MHRPLYADALALAPLDGAAPAVLRVQLDIVGLTADQHEDLARAVAGACGLPAERVIIAFSHTHASGRFEPARFTLPGGELLPAYLETLRAGVIAAAARAYAERREAVISYAVGRCDMAANRNFWDASFGGYVCGLNPDAPADDTLLAARVTDAGGRRLATLVNYACHPTTLAFQNTLTSPDFPGALRETVERETGAPCIYLQGACGDLGPRDDYTGDTAVADRNGRQVAHAALSALDSLGAPAADYVYQGPVISGATLGLWRFAPQEAARRAETERFAGATFHADLPLKPKPDPDALRAVIEQWTARQAEADGRGDAVTARDAGARAERARRWLSYLQDMPAGDTYPLRFSVYQLGDAFWVTAGGEPFSLIQTELRRRFPQQIVLFSPMTSDYTVAYLMPADQYGIGLYQEEPSILGKGCLEVLIEAITTQMRRFL